MNPALIFVWLPVMAIAIGLTRVRFPRLPWIAAGVLLAIYLLYLAAFGVYASRCWDCSAGMSETRGESFHVIALFLGIMLATALFGVWLGARLTVVVGRLFAAARDLRDATRSDGKHADV